MKIGFVRYNHMYSPKQKRRERNTEARIGGRNNPACEQHLSLSGFEVGDWGWSLKTERIFTDKRADSCSPTERDCTRILNDSRSLFILKSFRETKPIKIKPNQNKKTSFLSCETLTREPNPDSVRYWDKRWERL